MHYVTYNNFCPRLSILSVGENVSALDVIAAVAAADNVTPVPLWILITVVAAGMFVPVTN